MSRRSVLRLGDSRLLEECAPVTDFAAAALVIQDLWDTLEYIRTLYNFTRGCGIAAPQIGERIAVSVLVYNGTRYVLCNPRVIDHSDEEAENSEGCLSFFDDRGIVRRWTRITVEAQDADGHTYTITTDDRDFISLLLHEIDHLKGILYIDRMPKGAALTPKPGMPRIP